MTTNDHGPPRGLNTVRERRTKRTAAVLAAGTFVILAIGAFAVGSDDKPWWLMMPIAALLSWGVYFWNTRKIRRRRRILGEPFPAEWEHVLQRDVTFYRALDPPGQERFRRELQVFLGEKRVTGIKTDLDTTTLVLVGASAVIPIFGFPDWEWEQIEEVLVYPSRFDEEFTHGEGHGHHTLGMVGTGAMNRMMILSKPDLIHGFRQHGDKRNVGVHEFAHLVDKSDGTVDGLPATGLDREAIGPWIELVRRKMQEIRKGDSDIDDYALTNEAEFFAVASEYFFERPGVMQRKHPELYAMLARVFNQDLGGRIAEAIRQLKSGRKRLGRNSPCPCGSGVKYKKCCLGKSRA